jgi:hypothetical protein
MARTVYGLYATKRGERPRSLTVWSVCHGDGELVISRSSDSSKTQWSLVLQSQFDLGSFSASHPRSGRRHGAGRAALGVAEQRG